jgi:F0F1-type ATP synthase membrane subunit b/b'
MPPKIANSNIEMHLLLFAVCIIVAVVIGYVLGKLKEAALKKRILDVEDEMLHANKEVLHYAEENKQLTEALEKAKIPLPSITRYKEHEEKLRSIPLGKIG